MTRALLTEMERKALKGEIEDPNQRSTYISRVTERFENELSEDVKILKEYQPELFKLLEEQIE